MTEFKEKAERLVSRLFEYTEEERKRIADKIETALAEAYEKGIEDGLAGVSGSLKDSGVPFSADKLKPPRPEGK